MATVVDEAPQAGAGWGWLLTGGIVSLILGVLALLSPFAATLAATSIVGALFMVAGAVTLVAGFGGRGHARRGYLIIYGALSLLLGLLIIAWPLSAAITITTFIAAWLLVRGVLEIATGARIAHGGGLMIGLGVINILLAIVILLAPFLSALVLPGYILGISFLLGGAAETNAALHHRRGAAAFAIR